MSYTGIVQVGRYVPSGLTFLDVRRGPPEKKSYYAPLNPKSVVGVGIDAFVECGSSFVVDPSRHNLLFKENEFDVALLIDVIEYFEKERGLEVIEQSKKIASKYVFVLTPAWWESQGEEAKVDPFQSHRSFWTYNDFHGEGWLWPKKLESLKGYLFGCWVKDMAFIIQRSTGK